MRSRTILVWVLGAMFLWNARAEAKGNSYMGDPGSETITVTTYYPSPAGSYNELTANKFSLGNAPLPTRSGDIVLQRQPGIPNKDWPEGVEGQLTYSEQFQSLFIFDGKDWLRVSFNNPDSKKESDEDQGYRYRGQ